MKKYQSAFILVFAIYIIAGITAIILFYNNGSRLSQQLEQQTFAEQETVTASTPSESQQDSVDNSVNEAIDAQVQEAADTGSETSDADEQSDTILPATDTVNSDTSADTDADSAKTADSNDTSDDTTESADSNDNSADTAETADSNDTSDDTAESTDSNDTTVASSDSDTEGEDGKIYYGYTVNSGVSAVRVRASDNRGSNVVGHVNGGEKGYVIEKGKTRSKIVIKDGSAGYIYNEYITISEISKDDVPKEYR